MPLRTLHAGEGCQRVLACERSHEGFSCESGGGHACRERLPQAGLRSSYRRWAARHSPRPHAGRDRSPRDHADTLEQIHSGSDYRSRVTPQYLPIRASTPGKSATRKCAFKDLKLAERKLTASSHICAVLVTKGHFIPLALLVRISSLCRRVPQLKWYGGHINRVCSRPYIGPILFQSAWLLPARRYRIGAMTE